MAEQQRKETAQGALGVGARLNHHDERISKLDKKLNQLERKMESSDTGDLEISGKRIRICMDNGECYEGVVTGISKFRVKLKLEESNKERIFSKGHIRWHEEL